jgi:NAD(P)-dependent dehydrogenase (short-subunit alcohol dehydrogenase family)
VTATGNATVNAAEDRPGLAVVTGANRGLGLGLVRELRIRGWDVIAACRNPEAATDLAALGPEAILPLDTASNDSVAEFGLAARELLGNRTLDLLVNNAGVGKSGAPSGPTTFPLAAIDGEALDAMLRVNTIGPVLVTQALAPWLRAGSRVVMMSSRLGSLTVAYGRDLGYNVSKAALNMVAVVLAKELGERGAIVVTVHPGWVRTDMGGPHATLAIDEAMGPLADTISRLAAEHNGTFIDWLGNPMPW